MTIAPGASVAARPGRICRLRAAYGARRGRAAWIGAAVLPLASLTVPCPSCLSADFSLFTRDDQCRWMSHVARARTAKADFREAVKINPRQKEARDKLAECEKALRKERQDSRPRCATRTWRTGG